MAGKIVKTGKGKTGRTKNSDGLHYSEVMNNSNPFMARVETVAKVKVYYDDGGMGLVRPKDLETIGFWD